jgi:hypothetical protein
MFESTISTIWDLSMDMSTQKTSEQPILTADAIRKTLPMVCLTEDGKSKSKKSINNILSGFNQMLKLGLLDECRLVEQMEDEFALTKKTVKEYEAVHGKKSYPSFLNDVRAAANDIINFDTSKMTFSDTLFIFAKRYFGVHLSKRKLSILLNEHAPLLSTSTYYNWLVGNQIPKLKKSIESLNLLDEKLGANGALSEKIKQTFIDSPKGDSKLKTAFVLPAKLQKDVDDYVDFRTQNKIPEEMPYLSNMPNRTKEERRKIRLLKSVSISEWSLPSSKIFINSIILFAKFIMEKHPDKFDSMSLSTVLNHEYIIGFEDFLINRGTLSSGLRVLKWIKYESVKQSYASIYLHSEDSFCENIDDWLDELDLLNKDITLVMDRINKRHEQLDGARNIDWILIKDNPFDYIKIISDQLWKSSLYSSPSIAATAASIMFDMLLPCPIRAKNVREMRWFGRLSEPQIRKLHKEKVSALYFDESSDCFTIFVHKKELKNGSSTTISSIVQQLPHLSDKFLQYLNVRDIYLETRKWETDILFPIMKIAANIQKSRLDESGEIVDFRLGNTGVLKLLQKHTKSAIDSHFPEENVEYGINPHGMRHLSASLYLKDNSSDYTGLATLLMDNLETVTRIYARRDDIGNHKKIAEWAVKRTGGNAHAA